MSDDPFDKLSVPATALGSEAARRLYEGLGVLHARGAFEPEFLTAFKADILKIFDRMEQGAGRRIPYISFFGGDPETKPHIEPAYAALLSLAQQRLSEGFPYQGALLRLAGCTCVVRVVVYAREAGGDGPSAHVPFHQDHTSFLNFSGMERELSPKSMVTCWMPLDVIDAETPSIEYLPARLTSEVPTGSDGMTDPSALAPALEKLKTWVPPVALGDMCLHDRYTLHRSHVTPERVKRRASFELRLIMR